MRPWILMVGGLAGCGIWGDGGQSGTEVPDMCVESSRTPIADPGTPEGGLSFSPQQAIDTLGGTYEGELVEPTDARHPMTLTVAFDGRLELVQMEAVYSGDQGGAAVDIDTNQPHDPIECTPSYAIGLAITADTDDGLLAEAFSSLAETSDPSYIAWTGAVDVADVGGTTAPTSFAVEDWERVELVFSGAATPGQDQGSVIWSGSNVSGAGDQAVDTGYIEPSGMTETVGSWTLVGG